MGEYCPEEGSINGVIRFGKVDKAYIQRKSFLPRQLLQPTNHKHDIGDRTVRSETTLFLRQDPHALAELAEAASKSDDVTTLYSTSSQQGVDVADTVDAVDRCCTLNVPNVSSSSRDLALVAWCFLRTDFFSARFPRRCFRANVLRLLLSSGCFLPRFLPSFFRRVEYGNPTTPRLLHRRHCCLLTCALRAFLLSSLRVLRFPRQRWPNFATAGTLPRETISLKLLRESCFILLRRNRYS